VAPEIENTPASIGELSVRVPDESSRHPLETFHADPRLAWMRALACRSTAFAEGF
jgi:hypothetical protein